MSSFCSTFSFLNIISIIVVVIVEVDTVISSWLVTFECSPCSDTSVQRLYVHQLDLHWLLPLRLADGCKNDIYIHIYRYRYIYRNTVLMWLIVLTSSTINKPLYGFSYKHFQSCKYLQSVICTLCFVGECFTLVTCSGVCVWRVRDLGCELQASCPELDLILHQCQS